VTQRVTIEVLFQSGCPNAAAALGLVRRCIARLGLAARLTAREGNYPSPTVRVNGVDVMDGGPPAWAVCRLDLPTEEQVLRALRGAAEGVWP
jgi:hypothetical protein